MDVRFIDALARMFASDFPRRRLVGVLAVGLPTAWTARHANRAAAACKRVGQGCDRNRDCCDHAECSGGECRCKDGFADCGGKCKDLEGDEQCCGACDSACAANETC